MSCGPEGWVDKHGDYLFRYALRRLQNRQAAEDLVQETFLSALQGMDGFQQRSSERTWLVGILKHKLIDHIRKASRERSLREGQPAEDLIESQFNKMGNWLEKPGKWPETPLKELEAKEFREVFMMCLRKLPETMNQAFVLREMEGFGSDDITKVLKVTINNLNVILYRARAMLRKCLEKNRFT